MSRAIPSSFYLSFLPVFVPSTPLTIMNTIVIDVKAWRVCLTAAPTSRGGGGRGGGHVHWLVDALLLVVCKQACQKGKLGHPPER